MVSSQRNARLLEELEKCYRAALALVDAVSDYQMTLEMASEGSLGYAKSETAQSTLAWGRSELRKAYNLRLPLTKPLFDRLAEVHLPDTVEFLGIPGGSYTEILFVLVHSKLHGNLDRPCFEAWSDNLALKLKQLIRHERRLACRRLNQCAQDESFINTTQCISNNSDRSLTEEQLATNPHVPKAKRPKEWFPKALLELKEHPGWSDSQIARVIGVNKSTLSRDLEYKRAAARIRDSGIELRRGYIRTDEASGLRDVEAYSDDPAERDWDD